MAVRARLAAVVAALMLLSAPVVAQTPAPYQVPPAGSVVILFAVSDGATVVPVGSAALPPGALCSAGR